MLNRITQYCVVHEGNGMNQRTIYNGNNLDKSIPFTRECYTVITDEDYQPLPQCEQERLTRHMVEIRAVIDRQRDAYNAYEDAHKALVARISGKADGDIEALKKAERDAEIRLHVAAWRTCMIEEVYQ